jgi:ferritin
MLLKSIENLINIQIEKEGYSSSLYLAMASWAEAEGYEGITQWLYLQSDEERTHMLKFIHFINERGGEAVVPAFKLPPAKYKDVVDVFNQVLKHEEFITASINEIVALCNNEKDFSTLNFLQWYVNEQLLEEKAARAIIDKLKIVGKDNLYLFDKDIMAMRAAAEAAAPVA